MTCKQKQRYTKSGALKMRNKLYRRHSTKLRVYKCPECGYWHLTSMIYMKMYTDVNLHKEDRRGHREKLDVRKLSLDEDSLLGDE